MGFPLPAEPDVTDLAYYLVAIPDAPEYRQAIKGWYSELGKPWVWGAEKVTSGSYVAAQSWLRAIDETWRLIEMGWPDLVIQHIDDIETLLGALQTALSSQVPCCENMTTGDPPGGASSTDPVPQPVIDAGYATGSSDYTGYNAYKCMAAHLLINNLEAKLMELSPIVQQGAALLSVLLVLFGAVSGITGIALAGLVIGLGDVLTLIDALKDLGSISLEDMADEMEAARYDLVCAMVNGDGIDDTLAQFNTAVDAAWGDIPALIIKNLNVRHMMQLLMYGAHGNADIAAELAAAGYDPADYSCCEEEPPSGYELVPVDYGSCSGSDCGGQISVTGNVITLTGWTGTAGFAYSCTNPGNVVGGIHLAELTGTPAITFGTLGCSNNDIIGAGPSNPLRKDGYNFAFTSATHQTNWATYMSNHTPNTDHGLLACVNPTRQAFKHDAAGSISGTITSWHIVTV